MSLSVRLTSAFALCFVVAPIMAAGSGELHYQLPAGWVNLLDPAFHANDVPEGVMEQASNGKYVIYATDPSTATRESLRASFNVVEQKVLVKISQAQLKQFAVSEMSEIAQAGATMTIEDAKVSSLGSVPIGVITAMIELPQNSQRIVQYVVTSRTHTAVLTYGSRFEDFEAYRPQFERSAMATTGAYDHSGYGWRRGVRAALIGGLGGLAAYFVGMLAKKRRPALAAAAPQSATMWDCPTCKRRVPLRVDACRCGAARPA